MGTLIFVIQILCCSLAMSQQPLPNNTDRWWFLVTPMQSPAPSASVTSWQLSPCQSSAVRREDYTYTPGIGGHKVHTRAATWHDARQICDDEGGHLAIINSVAEVNAMVDLWNKAGSTVRGDGDSNWAHIGFHDSLQEGEYLTVHSQSLAKAGYTRWAGENQPDNMDGAENCGSIHKNGGLNDIKCHLKYAFICESPIY